MKALVLAVALALASLAVPCGSAAAPTDGNDPTTTSVGMPATLREVVLPGTEVEVAPADVHTAVVLRIAAVARHGTAFRYDLEYYGLDPGTYDLVDYLRRVDGSATDDLPALPVTVETVLAPGHVKPHALEGREVAPLGGYRTLLVLAGVVWLVVLVLIVRAGRRRPAADVTVEKPVSLADRLRPLVEAALAGTLSREDRAHLELTLIAFWRRKLALERTASAEALASLRKHAEAGPLLLELERWLHAPPGARAVGSVDVGRLLAPYRELPVDEVRAS
jgi:hypothetical protein